MLSDNTVKLLRNACGLSNNLYDQGGMTFNYLYNEGANHAISNVQEDLYSVESLSKLSHFVEVATSSFESSEISTTTDEIVKELIVAFGRDFNGLKAFLQSYEESGSSSTLTLLFLGSFGFHSLELFWSLD